MPTAEERDAIRISPVLLRIRNGRFEKDIDLGDTRFYFSEVDKDLVMKSRRGAGHTISEHMIWILNSVFDLRGGLKRARQNGVDIVLEVYSESYELEISPEAIVLPHKLNIPLIIKYKK